MTWYPAYLASKQDIVDFCITQVPNLSTGRIKDVDVRLADTALFSYLFNVGSIKGIYDGASGSVAFPPDQLSMLWGASLAYNCEFLSYRGIISYNVGGVQESRAGRVATQFMRMQPMFFMRNSNQGLEPLMPFRSFKQAAQDFLDSYISIYHSDSGTQGMMPRNGWDASSRGYGANLDLDYIKAVDGELTGVMD